MDAWVVQLYVRKNGRCPFDIWRSSKSLTTADRIKLDERLDSIEAMTNLSSNVMDRYQGAGMEIHEIRVSGDKKKLRPLVIKGPGKVITILCGSIEKSGKLPPGDLTTAENLAKELLKGNGRVKRRFE